MRHRSDGEKRRTSVGIAASALLVFLGACRADVGPNLAPPRPPHRAIGDIVIDTSETGWNYYRADVTITRAPGQVTPGVTYGGTQTQYTVERTLSGTVWSTDVHFAPIQPTGDGSIAPAAVDVSRLQTDDAGSYLRLYDANGTSLPTTPADDFSEYAQATGPGSDTIPPFPAPSGSSPRRVLPGGASSPLALNRPSSAVVLPPQRAGADPRAWFANIIVTPRLRAKLVAARARRFGAAVGQVGTLSRYRHVEGSEEMEELVDPRSGAMVEQNLAVNGHLEVHITRTFADVGHDRFLLSGIRVERAQPGDPVHPQVTDITYRNVHLETRSAP